MYSCCFFYYWVKWLSIYKILGLSHYFRWEDETSESYNSFAKKSCRSKEKKNKFSKQQQKCLVEKKVNFSSNVLENQHNRQWTTQKFEKTIFLQNDSITYTRKRAFRTTAEILQNCTRELYGKEKSLFYFRLFIVHFYCLFWFSSASIMSWRRLCSWQHTQLFTTLYSTLAWTRKVEHFQIFSTHQLSCCASNEIEEAWAHLNKICCWVFDEKEDFDILCVCNRHTLREPLPAGNESHSLWKTHEMHET